MKRKNVRKLGFLLAAALLLASCGPQAQVTTSPEPSTQKTQEEESTMSNNPIDEAIALETSKVDDEPATQSAEEERIPTAEIS